MLRTIGENLVLKILALGASILIWLYVGVEQNPTMTRVVNAEIKTRGDPSPKLLVRPSTEPIPVEISGPRSEVASIADNEVKAVVDLALARPSDQQLRVMEWQRPRRTPNVAIRPIRQFIDAEI